MYYLWNCIAFASLYLIQAKNQVHSSENEIEFFSNQKNYEDWPCPLAEDIAPCTCSYLNSRISLECQNIVELTELERIFSQHFPFPNMGTTEKKIYILLY